MEKDTHITPMLFRYDTSKDWKGVIFAIMPYEIASPDGSVTYYQHVGQHSSGDYNVMLNHSRPATEDEYKELLDELNNVVGYNVKVIKKRNYDTYLEEYKRVKNL